MSRLRPLAPCLLVALAGAAHGAQTLPRVRVLELAPEAGSSLVPRERVFVRLAYESDQPLRFQASARDGEGAYLPEQEFNPAPLHPAGSGEALAWLAFRAPVALDELVVTVSDAQWKELQRVPVEHTLRWSGATARRERTPPAWVGPLRESELALTQAQMPRPSAFGAALGSALALLLAASLPLYLVLQVLLVRAWRGGWRKAALVPLALSVPLAAYTLFALLAGSNLWPLAALFLTPLACLYLLLLALARRWSPRRA